MAAQPLSIVVAGGGTAGHIEPALAVAEAFEQNYHARVSALGTKRGLEKDLVPARGFQLHYIDPVPVSRKLNLDLLKLPARLLRAVRQARAVLKDVKADALIGFGGYVSAPAYIAAKTMRVPFFVHEANARAGLANKLGVRLGGVGFSAVEGSGIAGTKVGIPVRASLRAGRTPQARARGLELFGLDPQRATVLITGGSQGAVSINKAVAGAVDTLTGAGGVQVLHAFGKRNTQPAPHEHYHPLPYIEDMAAALSVADMIVCRSGAMTVAEATAAGLPAVYIPLPHGNGEQALNALEVVAAGAAILIDDASLTPDRLVSEVMGILGNEQRYEQMRQAASTHQSGDAAGAIARAVVDKLARQHEHKEQ